MTNNKFLLPLILILLILTLPLGIYGLIVHNQEVMHDTNYNKDHKFNGKLYYYNGDELLGTYTCVSADCDDVKTTISDKYLMVESGISDTIGLVNKNTALVSEDNTIKLVSLLNNHVKGTFNEVINYGYESIPFIIVQLDDQTYTVLSTFSAERVTFENYKYIGLINSPLTAGTFSVFKDGKFYIIQASTTEELKISADFTNPIVYYTNNIIVIKNVNRYEIYNYKGELLDNDIKMLDTTGSYVVTQRNNNGVYVYTSEDVKEFYEEGFKYTYTINEDKTVTIFREGSFITQLS